MCISMRYLSTICLVCNHSALLQEEAFAVLQRRALVVLCICPAAPGSVIAVTPFCSLFLDAGTYGADPRLPCSHASPRTLPPLFLAAFRATARIAMSTGIYPQACPEFLVWHRPAFASACCALKPYEIHQVCAISQVCSLNASLVTARGTLYVRRSKKSLGNFEYFHRVSLLTIKGIGRSQMFGGNGGSCAP